MDKLSSYPKVHTLGHRRIAEILDGDYHIEEKLDGSQFSFGIKDGNLCCRSKGQVVHIDYPEKMFSKAVTTVECIAHKLKEGLTYRAEYLRNPKHNTLVYDRVPNGHLMVFDVEDKAGNPLPYGIKRRLAEDLGLECVPRIEVNIVDSESIVGMLSLVSCLGGQKIEGIVIKNYTKWTDDGKFMAGKYVSEAFKEKHDTNWKKDNPGQKDIVSIMVGNLKTDARYQKAVQHLMERGELTREPQDIGKLMKELHLDIEAEEADYIKEVLYKHFINQIKRGVCGGFPEWYKEQLLQGVDYGNDE